MRFACRSHTALRQPYGLTTFPAHYTTGLGPASSPVVRMATCSELSAEQPTTYLLVSAYQQLWHCNAYGVYQQFTYVAHTSQPGSSTPLLLGVSASLPLGSYAPLRGLRCQESFTPHSYP
ncbi:Retrotransposon protein, putative, Ty1-copia subclass from Oryza sativa (japonica cultivar-group) [Cupriavidus metallidurans CH34]|uniref:Retrotransposon protein, putative, Ty1-copia subclass from Oryza sativa (Japonica cultivar-group) n=1 Tax=Cupriavidus metallidurans (strain ATCC 43123 / DSM 2839 / NBRC 102507 / CH34) TaxID=266264 RepID=Q1LJC1_CUPMC|nr:Retrotransposon protein, putative, Ty1-copia subclass from Oryza sativa (japonica cultivar-group) [Cupriavidus metallidurans CH34]